jgi:arylsulfatase A
MLEVDAAYDAAVSAFMRRAVLQEKKPFFFYFASHHTHAPQFASAWSTNSTRRGLFGDSLNLLDRSVGNVLDTLDELGIANETLVVFSADNGGSLHWHELGGVNGDLRCGKGTTWEGGHRVPTMVRWPSRIPGGSVNRGISASLDWFPTVASLAGVPLPANVPLDGMDLSPMLFAAAGRGGTAAQLRAAPSPRDFFAYHTTKGAPRLPDGGPGLMAFRKGGWKIHWYTQGSHCTSDYADDMCYAPLQNWTEAPLLYNVETDPSEVLPFSNSTTEFQQWAPALRAAADEYLSTFESGVSQIGKGSDAKTRFPCCSPDCTPRPDCCKCPPGNGAPPLRTSK